MTKLLTTGEMIDRLKVDEKAIGYVNDLGTVIKVLKDSVGHIKFCDTKDLLVLNAGIVDSVKWRILPKYVSFEEAIKALKEKKIVHYHPTESQQISNHIEGGFQGWMQAYNWEQLINGKWTIEED